MVRRPPARHGVLAASRSTVRLPRPSASPSARPRCSWQTVSGSAAATSANGQRPSTSSVVRPRPARPEAAAGQFLFQQASQVTSARQSGGPPVTFLPGRLKRTCCRRTAAAGRLGSQARAGRARFPAPSGCSRGAAGPVTAYGLLGHQSRVLEHRQVLAHSVVVQPDESGELGHDHRCRRVGELAEEAVARRVTPDHGFAPQVRGHGSPFRRENV